MNKLTTKTLFAAMLITSISVQASEFNASKFTSMANCDKSGTECIAAIIITDYIPKVDPVCECPTPVGFVTSENSFKFTLAVDKVEEFKAASKKDMVASAFNNISWKSPGEKIDFVESVNKMSLGFKILENGSFKSK